MMAALLITMAAVSCKSTLPSRFESFVANVEKNQAEFTDDDWTKADEQFAKLKEEYEQKKESLNSEQKQAIDAAIGKYQGLRVKNGIKDLFDDIVGGVSDIASQAVEAVGGFLKGLAGGSDAAAESTEPTE